MTRKLMLSPALMLAAMLCTTVALYGQAGGSAVPFLLISPDARASGMGECGTAVADNLYAVHWNTGGLAFQRDQQVALSFSRWLPQFNADLFYSYGTYGRYFKELDGMVAVNFILMNLGQFERRDINGNNMGYYGGPAVANGEINNIAGIAPMGSEKYYISSYNNGKIVRFR